VTDHGIGAFETREGAQRTMIVARMNGCGVQ
jgi:hypothetical protein